MANEKAGVSPEIGGSENKFGGEKDGFGKEAGELRDIERQVSPPDSLGKGDILGLEHTDPVLNAKMHLVNNVRTSRWSILLPKTPWACAKLNSLGN